MPIATPPPSLYSRKSVDMAWCRLHHEQKHSIRSVTSRTVSPFFTRYNVTTSVQMSVVVASSHHEHEPSVELALPVDCPDAQLLMSFSHSLGFLLTSTKRSDKFSSDPKIGSLNRHHHSKPTKLMPTRGRNHPFSWKRLPPKVIVSSYK
ncbi:hypothetical protein NPIL_638121 [Nephila pilipes]|uniref:Uncharacterized protein n=1 Tax=Nephila pilipes TaxID=299642 RepID=A0A8X6P2J7_NEPPI|nr:hypothetical protein NPIL_638121 [Nephila pilipes]